MSTKSIGISALLCACLTFIAVGCTPNNPQKLTIATAANMQFAMQELIGEFTRKTGIECDMVVGSSGKLTAQISAGAPYDIFVAANMKYPMEVHKNGLAYESPEVYAFGTLVLWTMDEKVAPSLDSLVNADIRHIAVANPKTAPYGVAAMEVLEYYDLFEKIKQKLVYGESIAQTDQFIVSRSAQIGFTAKSVVLSPRMRGNGRWIELDDAAYSRIDQGVVRVKRENADTDGAKQFYDFLFSGDAHKILNDFGYLVNER